MDRLTEGLLTSTAELRRLIIENPNLPLLVFAGESSNNGDYSYMSCSCVRAEKGEVLNCDQGFDDERVFTDRDDFEDAIRYRYDDFDGSDKEFDDFIESKMLEYAPFWTPCIVVYVNN